MVINTDKYVVFGGVGCLDKEIAQGKVMVPIAAYRDEGASYHYAPASDYVEVKNADIVAEFMETVGLPYVKGKTWTTDAVHREKMNKRPIIHINTYLVQRHKKRGIFIPFLMVVNISFQMMVQ